MMLTLCPNCGFDLEDDEPIKADGIFFDPRGDIFWQSRPLFLSAYERIILGSLLKDRGRFVNRAALMERIDSNSDNNVIEVLVSRLRAKMRRLGCEAPIETKHRQGYRWNSDEVAG